MSEKEVIRFTCPHCETRLTVPVNLSEIVGPCPKCRVSISAPKPRIPIPAKPKPASPPPVEHPQPDEKTIPYPQSQPYTPQRSSWVALLIPLFFLVLTIGVVVSLFYGVSKKNSENPTRHSESRADLTNSTTQNELSEAVAVQPPGLEIEPLPSEILLDPVKDEALENAEFVLKSREVLAAFLEARDLTQRQPFLSASDRSEEDLSKSILASTLPNYSTPALVLTQLNGPFLKAYFSTVFEDGQSEISRPLILQIISSPNDNQIKVNTDAFLDAYQQKVLKLSQTPTAKIETTTCLISYSSFSFDDIPFSDKMALIEFHKDFAKDSPPTAKAYVTRASEVFLNIRAMGSPGEVIPCTLTLGWELETNPERPFLKVLQLDSTSWMRQ